MTLEKSDRPWGRYEVLQESDTHKVKCIWVTPGQRLSYQRHAKRAEHWFIVKGTGRITINGELREVAPGDTVDFGIGVLHRIANTGSEERLSLLKFKREVILVKMTLSALRMTLADEQHFRSLCELDACTFPTT